MKGQAIVGVLTERQEKLLDLFKGAIERERETQEIYREMLPFSDDPDITRIIEGFVGEEKRHEETLLRLYSAFRSAGGQFSDAT